MKLLLKQSGKALLYLLLFFFSQVIVTIGMTFFYYIKYSIECAGMDETSLTKEVTEILTNNTNLMVLISGCVTIFWLWIFVSLIRRKNLLEEAGIRSFKPINVPVIITLGVTTAFMMNYMLSFVPEKYMKDYASESQNLMKGSLVIAFIATVIAAPIVEEIIFRGFILSALKSAMPVMIAVAFTSLLFAVMHGQIIWISYTFVLGILFCVVAIRTNSIVASMLYHLVFNLSGILVPCFMPETSKVVNACISCATLLLMILLLSFIVKINMNNGNTLEVQL